MEKPPKRLDGAVVLHYVILSKHHRRIGVPRLFVGIPKHLSEWHEIEPPVALAICQYAGDKGFYLFYCATGWEVLTDDLCSTLADAFRLAERQFEGLTDSEWSTMEDSAQELDGAQREESIAQAALPEDYATEDTIRRLVSEGKDLEAIARLQRVRGLSLYEAYTTVSRIKGQQSK